MTFEPPPYRIAEALSLSQSLGLSRPLAVALARRGFADPDLAREFLAGEESHDAGLFEGMPAAVSATMEAIEAGRRVTVYGDFDVDGVAATAIVVGVLRQLGADCDWFIPDRIVDGYGLSEEAIRGLPARGTGLVITVDCGVTAVDEVALAKSLGMEVLVTDHHRPGPVLPDCEILHPEVSGYPFKELCGAAVAAKFATGLRRAADLGEAGDQADLDLVALATVADVVPLIGENRRLVKEGLRVARRAERPGMRALIAECRVEPSHLSASDFGFRLGPRINAAGRVYRADAGVELFLAESGERAAEISVELSRANTERRRIEREVEAAAEAARRLLEEPEPRALVVAGQDWHPGVVGIVAAKLSRNHGVPSVVLSIDGDDARGSARSVPGLDLHAAIAAASHVLEGFGGHAAAAGVQIKTERIAEFRAELEAAVVAQIGTQPELRPERVDAFVGGDEIGLDLAEEIESLEPCGQANPSLSLLVPGARICDVREIGEGKHCRFTVVSGGSRCAGVSFGRTGFGVDEDTPLDVLAELTVNHWNGSVESQLLVREATPVPGADASDEDLELSSCEPEEWWARFEAGGRDMPAPEARDSERRSFSLDCPAEVALAELASSRQSLLVITADSGRRWRSLGGQAGIGRFSGSGLRPIAALWSGSPRAATEAIEDALADGVVVCEYGVLVTDPGLATRSRDVVLFDPPAGPEGLRLASAGSGFLYRISDPAATAFAERASADRHELTAHLRAVYRGLRDAGESNGERLRSILIGSSSDPRSPEAAATLFRVLVEAGLVRTAGSGDAREAGVVSSERVNLRDSAIFCEQARIHEEQIAFLRQSNK